MKTFTINKTTFALKDLIYFTALLRDGVVNGIKICTINQEWDMIIDNANKVYDDLITAWEAYLSQ